MGAREYADVSPKHFVCRVLQPVLPFSRLLWSRTVAPKVRRDVKIAFAWDGELSELGLEAKERYLMEVN